MVLLVCSKHGQDLIAIILRHRIEARSNGDHIASWREDHRSDWLPTSSITSVVVAP